MDFTMDQLQSITSAAVREGDLKTEIILDQQYQVIAHSDRPELGKRYLEADSGFVSALAQVLSEAESREGFFSLYYENADYEIYAAPVSNEWLCISVFDATSVFSQLKSTMIFMTVLSPLVVIMLLLIYVCSRSKQEQFLRHRSVVEALAAAIDAKDRYTNGHSGRVADYAKEISRRCGYSPKRQDEIYMMGLLHDVGKIGIPDTVINKPGKLTEEEFAVIMSHPVIGAQILSTTAEMKRMAIGAHWHHERYDGKGYPDGIAGEAIPEEARIIAVADAYDAMTSRRSYRDVMPQSKVRAEIESCLGTQFDPGFGKVMIQMIDEDTEYEMREHTA
ncbi:MAG: HD domain-containing protein [Oscillospiraceae bacterium]|nr:HD domain-containing protein [Oscillospiraceae bacterium]